MAKISFMNMAKAKLGLETDVLNLQVNSCIFICVKILNFQRKMDTARKDRYKISV